MNETKVVIISKSEELPPMQCRNFFHSEELFRVMENTHGQKPYMAIAYDGNDIVAHMLVMLRRRGSLLPPYLFTQGRVYGEGEYKPGYDKENIFGLMLKETIKKLRRNLCLYIEFSDISSKMFGYRLFRNNGFFPVHWMEIHNSLHSMSPTRRLTPKMKKYITNSWRYGITAGISKSKEDFYAFFRILKNYITLKIRRYIPDSKLFTELIKSNNCNFFTTRYKGEVTGGCLCVYSDDNCYLWYLATKHKLHRKQANAATVWAAIKHAHQQHYRHIYFMDVGLPFKKNKFREFILGFGGKPVGTYRWFRCSIKWINDFLSWCYRE